MSNWAKRQLRRGKNINVDTLQVLSAQLAMEGDIWNKMKTVRGDGCDDESEEESNARLVEKARALLRNSETKKDEKRRYCLL
mmetsp:Transcript_6907/g.7056  ORF Transcript_6907/g.7056 Transcript_6907/m.7056 type:complete len:82 (+) Transcript_6907:26-271(+)